MEIEIKYAPVPHSRFAEIANALGLSGGETVKMSAEYFDTADGFLSDNKISLRRRAENGKSVYTMKRPLGMVNGVAVREEEETAAGSMDEALRRFAENPSLAEAVEKCRKSRLVTIADMDFVRIKYNYEFQGAVLEISHDTGKMHGKNGGEGEILEMEIELKSGGKEAIDALRLRLEGYALPVESRSKLARARLL